MFNVRDHTILFTIAGSRSYGIHNSTSDVDVKGICIPPVVEYRLGILNSFEQADSREHLARFFNLLTEEEKQATILDCRNKNIDITAPDGQIYDIAKFFKLALNANPNILEVLFCDEEDIRLITPAGQKIRDNRDLFLSQKVVWSYQGYSFSQMKRIERHRGYLLSPREKPPERSEFNLPENQKLVSNDEQQAFLWLLCRIMKEKIAESRLSEPTKKELEEADIHGMLQSHIPDEAWPKIGRLTGVDSTFLEYVKREKAYSNAVAQWRSYQNWKVERNKERAGLEGKFGFDLKHAAHLARLMSTCEEILQGKGLLVRRPDKDFLIGIRNGEMSYKELLKWFRSKQESIRRIADTSKLPKEPERKKANQLLIELQEATLETR